MRGFTLVEILVVMVLLAIATMAGLTALRDPAGNVALTGRRLARTLERLALEARLAGQKTSWRCDGARLIFETWEATELMAPGAWRPWTSMAHVALDDSLRIGKLTLEGQPVNCGGRVVFPVFGNAPEFSLEILNPSAADEPLSIVGDAAGRVRLLGGSTR